MNKHTLEALDLLIDYIYDDEAKNYEESEKAAQKNHIFNTIKFLSNVVKEEWNARIP